MFVSYEKEHHEVSALISKRDSLEVVYKNVPFDEIIRVGETSLKKLDSVMKMLESKKIELKKEDGIFLGRYRGISKPFRKMDKTQYKLEYDLKFSKDQLVDLEKDISNKALPKDSVSIFLKDESKALEVIESNLTQLLNTKDLMVEEFEKNEAQINELISSLN